MPRKLVIAPRKQPRQERAIATVETIVKAGIGILHEGGWSEFTSNKIAEKAEVNIATFYKYFPNKNVLLFHIVQQNSEEQFARIGRMIGNMSGPPSERLRAFVRMLMLIEAADIDLRLELRAASGKLRGTAEFDALMEQESGRLHDYLRDVLRGSNFDAMDFHIETTYVIIKSFAERTATGKRSRNYVLRQAGFLSDLLIAHFASASDTW